MEDMRIATLIPAYKSGYIEKTLLSLSRQTYRHFDCYLSDDSPGGEVGRKVENLKSSGIVNFPLQTLAGPKSGLAIKNIQNLLHRVEAGYDLIHILFDDDLIRPDFYKRHVSLHCRAKVSVTASARYFINGQGLALAKTPIPSKVASAKNDVMILADRYVAATTIPSVTNWIGEYSNMVFNVAHRLDFGLCGDGRIHYGLADLSAAIFVGERLGYIRDHLGGFRVHADSMTAQVKDPSRMSGLLAWVPIAQSALSNGLIEESDVLCCVTAVKRYCDLDYAQDPLMVEFSKTLASILRNRPVDFSEFNERWSQFLIGNFGEFWRTSPVLA